MRRTKKAPYRLRGRSTDCKVLRTPNDKGVNAHTTLHTQSVGEEKVLEDFNGSLRITKDEKIVLYCKHGVDIFGLLGFNIPNKAELSIIRSKAKQATRFLVIAGNFPFLLCITFKFFFESPPKAFGSFDTATCRKWKLST
jgi:hypothetical protein